MKTKKKNLKNKLRAQAKQSQYKTEQVLRCFAEDLSTKDAAQKTRMSVSTVRKRYAEFRSALFQAALCYRQLFNGAGIVMAFGPPPHAEEMIQTLHRRRQGRSRSGDRFIWEIVIRDYARFYYSDAEQAALGALALFHLARFHNILITECRNAPAWMGLVPEAPATEMSYREFLSGPVMELTMKQAIVDLWVAVEKGRFQMPDYVWTLLFKDRPPKNPAERIYRDLRWYLLKHPHGSDRVETSDYWDSFPSPSADEVQQAMAALFSRLGPSRPEGASKKA